MSTLQEDVRALARRVTDTDDPVGPAIAPLYARLPRTVPAVLDECAEILFEAARRPCPVTREGNLYLVGGALVEHGANPEIGWVHLEGRLAEGLAALAAAAPTPDRVDLDQGRASLADPNARDWAQVFRFFVIAAMARLARRASLRTHARGRPGLLRDLRTVDAGAPSHHAHYLLEVLGGYDGPLLLVDLPNQRVERLEVEGVRNSAHLMTMLDGGDPRALADAGQTVDLRHHYATYGCLDRRDGRLVDADWMFLLGVEVPVGQIPVFDLPDLGRTGIVVRAAPRLGARTFRANEFFAPIHDNYVESVRVVGSVDPAALDPVVAAARALRTTLGRDDGRLPLPPGLMEHPAWLDHWAVGPIDR